MIKTITFSALFILLFGYSYTFAGNCIISAKDSTVAINPILKKGKGSDSVTCSFNDSTLAYSLKIGNDAASGVFQDAFDVDLQIFDIDRDNGFNVLAVTGNGRDEDNEYFFYEYIDGKIIPCGHIDYAKPKAIKFLKQING